MANELGNLDSRSPRGAERVKQLAPLFSVLLLVVLITLSVLPSSLNLPQSNPSTILEYAPVPPDNDAPPPIQSGFSSLGLAGSSSLRTGIGLPPPVEDPTRDIPPLDAQKRCVQGRQTEDPSSPPCQQFFTGENGGATWQGVTGDEITILIYNQVGNSIDRNTGKREPTPSSGTYCDVDTLDCNGDGKSTGTERHQWMRIANTFSRYFNARYQTYGRHVHFWYYWTTAETASARRGDAADNWEKLKPFAVLNQTWWGGHAEAYAEAMAFRDVMVLAGYQGALPRRFYQQYAPKVFGYWPDVENWADMYVGYLCNKVKDTPVTDAGPDYIGQPRKYGLMYTDDPHFPNLAYFKDLVTAGIKGCGMIDDKVTAVTFPSAEFAVDGSGDQTYGQTNAAKLKDAGVNTVLWLGGTDTKTSAGAARNGYFPQWIIAGDRNLDGWDLGRLQDQNVWRYAWIHSYNLKETKATESPAYQAYKEASPESDDWFFALRFYRDYFMLFMSVQVAGPKIAPDAVDAGLHAIQRRDSTSPYVAACYFFPRDYSCVKDGTEMWWDPDANDSQDGGQGCWRMVGGGARYPRDRWHEAKGAGVDVYGYNQTSDPCNGYNNGYGIRI